MTKVQPNKHKRHWNKVYSNKPQEKLGWFETDLNPALQLINKTGLDTTARILLVGAGSTTLVDELIKVKYSNIIATDISEIALSKLKQRVDNQFIELIIDDLTNPIKLLGIKPVDLWIDRAVLHFFMDKKEQSTYFDLLKSTVKVGGFALLAQFSLEGADKCSGLPINRYSKEMLQTKLGKKFSLIDSFDYTYIMPSSDTRPYIYTLFKRN